MKFPVRMIGAHGAMHAYDTGEMERLQKLGWAVEVPDPPVIPVINGADVPMEKSTAEALKEALAESMRLDPPIVLPVVDEPPKRKPGRPRKAE